MLIVCVLVTFVVNVIIVYLVVCRTQWKLQLHLSCMQF